MRAAQTVQVEVGIHGRVPDGPAELAGAKTGPLLRAAAEPGRRSIRRRRAWPGKPNVIGVSASWVGDGAAWVTDIRQARAGPHTMLFAPNGPLVTVRSTLTCPLAPEVTLCRPFRSQSPGPVAAPFAAHWVTTRDSPGEKPDACTRTFWPDLSPVAGDTETFWCPLGAGADEVAVAEAVAGAVVVAGGELMLGWRAAENLGLHAGDSLRVGDRTYRVAGIYSTGQALGDTGAMFPLAWFQAYQRQPSQYTLLFVVITPGAPVAAVQARVDRDFPQLVTVRTLQQFGRADRSLSLILAADKGATVLALVIGAIVVMSAMTMSFIERTREFGVLAAIGWTRRRVAAMIMSEALLIGLIGSAARTWPSRTTCPVTAAATSAWSSSCTTCCPS